ncbi:CLB4 [Sanghuangporus weigelae]
MAFNTKLRPRIGPQRPKLVGDENANALVSKHVKQASVGGPIRVPLKTGPQRPALGEVNPNAINKHHSAKLPVQGLKGMIGLKRGRSATLDASSGAQRIPLGPIRPNVNVATSNTATEAPARLPLRPQRPPVIRQSETAPELSKLAREPEPESEPEPEPEAESEDELSAKEDSMDVEEEEKEVAEQVAESRAVTVKEPIGAEPEAEVKDESEDDDDEDVPVELIWPAISPKAAEKYRNEIGHIQKTFHDEVDMFDTTMVSEYSEEIFDYMSKLELEMMPNPDYIQGQSDLNWDMRQTLVDWLLQVHLRYYLLPETLWIAINLVDRFLSKRIVSVVKLQLVGVVAMFIAAKYEEILAPSVEEFVFMTEGGYSKEEILKGERIVMQTLDFKISSYCSPYSWVRRISKADEYDIQTRTLCKYIVEVTLLDYRFLRVKPSLVAAVGMYTARRMLGTDWNNAFVFYSGYTEAQLLTGHSYVIGKLLERGFDRQYVSRKYASKKYLKASVFAMNWARMNGTTPEAEKADEMVLEA